MRVPLANRVAAATPMSDHSRPGRSSVTVGARLGSVLRHTVLGATSQAVDRDRIDRVRSDTRPGRCHPDNGGSWWGVCDGLARALIPMPRSNANAVPMTSPPTAPTDGRPASTSEPTTARRRFLAVCGGVGTALLAGCAGNTGFGGQAESDRPTGRFRLLVSDDPADIGDFDSLTVTFDRGRLFNAEAEGNDDETSTATDAVNETESPADNETDTATATLTETERPTNTTPAESPTDGDEDADDGEQKGWSIIDLSGESADLTQLVGEKAQPIFEGELPAGRYTKLELHVADVEGIVDDEAVDVFVPSGKLQLTKPFEVEEGEEVSFVFDIHVVRKGSGGYNLRPVVSESGVAGEDVPTEEVEPTTSGDETTDNETQPDASPMATDGNATATDTTG